MKITRLLCFAMLAVMHVTTLAGCGDSNLPEDTANGTSDPSTGIVGDDRTSTAASDTTEAPTPEKKIININSFYDLNTDTDELDSHAKEIEGSHLELDYRSAVLLSPNDLGTTEMHYPRLKKLSDGSFIMFYNTGVTGPGIKYIRSKDGVTWSTPKSLASSQSLAGGDRSLFATADAVELENGDIVVAYSFRTEKTYTSDLSKSGIAVRISHDKGETWTLPKTVYVGMNWEPHLIQDKNGTVYLAFTHTAPYVHLYGYNNTIRSSGSAIIRSTDNGITWTPYITEAPYVAQRVMQSYIGDLNGRKIFNDQMPVMLQLNTGAIMMACESRQLDNTYFISLGYSYDGWAKELGLEEVGPEDRNTNMASGTGPYLAQFPSGETVLSYGHNGFVFRIGNADGKVFGAEYRPFSDLTKTVHWGMVELDTSHSLYGVLEDKQTRGDSKFHHLLYGKLCLNHRINAAKFTPELTGSAEGWENNTDAIFIGSVSQAQASYRFAHDDENVYVLLERLDYSVTKEDKDLIFLAREGSKKYIKLTSTQNGVTKIQAWNGTEFSNVDVKNVKSVANTVLAADVGGEQDVGYAVEIVVPKSMLDGITDKLMVNIQLGNTDGKDRFENDVFEDVTITDPRTWRAVVLD